MSVDNPLAAGAAPGKVILFGEHSVVYGRTAVAAALTHGLGASAEKSTRGPLLRIPRWGTHGLEVQPVDERGADAVSRAFATALHFLDYSKDEPVLVTIDGALPLGVGLGSSAAFAVALLRALADYRTQAVGRDLLMTGANAIEKVFHGQPSGLDHTVVINGGCVRYQRDDTPHFQAIEFGRPIPLVVAWTPRHGSTREAVDGLRARYEALPAHYDSLFSAMGTLAEDGIKALESGDLPRLGALMDLNHGYLNACGVSHPSNETMVTVARAHGAFGAKLTGAGLGGAVIALPGDEPDTLAMALRSEGFDAFVTELRNPPRAFPK